MSYAKIKKALHKKANKKSAHSASRFFKTGEGQYGEGDTFLGITVPEIRRIAKDFNDTPLPSIKKCLQSQHNEERLFGLILLCNQYIKAESENERSVIYSFTLEHIKRINNWNLVDLVAPTVFGRHLLTKKKSLLYSLVDSNSLWERRIAIVTTLHFIKNNSYDDCLKITRLLLKDKEDLIHKACGWMLREVGKKDKEVLTKFLHTHIKQMPRTTLRYAIERYPEKERRRILSIPL